MRIDQFSGIQTDPDETSVGSRLSRNILFGPENGYIETRPGTEQLSRRTQLGADATLEGRSGVYLIEDDRFDGQVVALGMENGDEGTAEAVFYFAVAPSAVTAHGGGNETPIVPPPIGFGMPLINSAFDTAKFASFNRTASTFTELAATVSGTAPCYLCNDTLGGVWIAVRQGTGASASYSIRRFAPGSSTPTSVGTITRGAQTDGDGVNLWGTAKRDGTGIWIMGADASDQYDLDVEEYIVNLYSTTFSAVALVGAVSIGTTNYTPVGLDYHPDGDLVFLTVQVTADVDPGDYSIFLNKVDPATATLRSGYPVRIDDQIVIGGDADSSDSRSAQMFLTTDSYLYFSDSYGLRRVAWEDVGTSNGAERFGTVFSNVFPAAITLGLQLHMAFAVDPTTDDFVVCYTIGFTAAYDDNNVFVAAYDASAGTWTSYFTGATDFADITGTSGFRQNLVWQDADAFYVNYSSSSGGSIYPSIIRIDKSALTATVIIAVDPDLVDAEHGYYYGGVASSQADFHAWWLSNYAAGFNA